MSGPTLAIRLATYDAIRAHLIRIDPRVEEAAFAFAIPAPEVGQRSYGIESWIALGPNDFTSRSDVHFELAEEVRGRVIKKAHDLGASIVEFHSHIDRHSQARFSYSDRLGFSEIVPHVFWRLNGRPYFSIVMTHDAFDGLAWIEGPEATERLETLNVGGEILTPSGLSPLKLEEYAYTF